MNTIEKYLNSAIPLSFDIRPELSSTNTVLREMAANGAAEGTVLIAQRQSAGRGRLGRSFFSPDGSGLYMSLLLRPAFAPAQAAILTTAAAAAAAIAIEQVSAKGADIKWVNDIFMEGKKVCGILCEAAFDASGSLDFVIAGVGINITAPAEGFPPEISDIAGAVFTHDNSPEEAKEHITATFLNTFTAFYANMDAREYFPEYKKRSFLLGREINVLRNGEATPATALDLNDECNLLVRYRDGREEYLNSGEVSIRAI